MKKNMGGADRTVRTGVALAVAALILTGAVSGWLAVVLGVLAAVFLVTSAVGFCPLYAPFGLATCGPREEPRP